MAQLPAIRPSCEVIGPLRPEAAEALNPSPRCRVGVGTYRRLFDGVEAALGRDHRGLATSDHAGLNPAARGPRR
jgi:sugar (pentulose or hexulose) kinase